MDIDVKKLAKLSRLIIDDEKEELYKEQMSSIIEMVDVLPSFESDESLLDAKRKMELRKDTVSKSYDRDDILENAPESKDGGIAVPKIIE